MDQGKMELIRIGVDDAEELWKMQKGFLQYLS